MVSVARSSLATASIILAMVELGRTVRFFLNGSGQGQPAARHNGFSAWPAVRGLGRFTQLHVRCRGEIDPTTGYFININLIDQAVRHHVVPYLDQEVESTEAADVPMGTLMRTLVQLLQPAMNDSVQEVRLDLSPFCHMAIRSDPMNRVIVSQQYEFAAAHRLHVEALGEDENKRIFGKCNHASGHGHNYRVDVAVSAPIDDHGRVVLVEDLDAVVDSAVIERFDHKNLNTDVPQFANLNPTVENIARVIYEILRDKVSELGAELDSISVWETSKTVCTYRGESASPQDPSMTSRAI